MRGIGNNVFGSTTSWLKIPTGNSTTRYMTEIQENIINLSSVTE